MNRANLILLKCYLCILCLNAGCAAFSKDLIYEDKLVKIYERNSLLPHGTDVQYLEVGGKTFDHLYSGRYVLVQEWNSILFVTHRDGSNYKIHIFDLTNKKDGVVESKEPFGSHLGYPKSDSFGWQLGGVTNDKALFTTIDHFATKNQKERELKYEVDRIKKTVKRLD